MNGTIFQLTINGTLHCAENSGTSGGPCETGVEAGAEGTGAISIVLNHEVVAINLDLTLVDSVQVQLLQDLI